MNRILYIGISVLLVAAPVAAQRGFQPGVGGHLSAPYPSGAGVGVRVPSSTALGALAGRSTPLSTPAFRNPGYFAYSNARPARPGTRGFRGRDYRQVPYGVFFAPYYYPWLDYGSAPYYDTSYDPGPDPNAQANMMAVNVLGDQIQRLTAEVDQLRSGTAPEPPYAESTPTAQPAPPPPITPPITLVLRDGQQLQVQNYAVMGQTFWDFSNQITRKIPVSNIDLAASAKATEASGGEFPQLTSTR